MIDYNCVILAAGKSRRMGCPKIWLSWNSQKTFLEKIARQYEQAKEIVVVINEENYRELSQKELALPSQVRFTINEHLEHERFYSLQLGMRALRYKHPCFVQPIDQPFVRKELIAALAAHPLPKGYRVPVFKGKGGHPILLSYEAVTQVKSHPNSAAHLRQFLRNFQRENISWEDEQILQNIDTPSDYQKFFESESRC